MRRPLADRPGDAPPPTFAKQVRNLIATHQTYTIEPANPQIAVLAPDATVASVHYQDRAMHTTGKARRVTLDLSPGRYLWHGDYIMEEEPSMHKEVVVE